MMLEESARDRERGGVRVCAEAENSGEQRKGQSSLVLYYVALASPWVSVLRSLGSPY